MAQLKSVSLHYRLFSSLFFVLCSLLWSFPSLLYHVVDFLYRGFVGEDNQKKIDRSFKG